MIFTVEIDGWLREIYKEHKKNSAFPPWRSEQLLQYLLIGNVQKCTREPIFHSCFTLIPPQFFIFLKRGPCWQTSPCYGIRRSRSACIFLRKAQLSVHVFPIPSSPEEFRNRTERKSCFLNHLSAPTEINQSVGIFDESQVPTRTVFLGSFLCCIFTDLLRREIEVGGLHLYALTSPTEVHEASMSVHAERLGHGWPRGEQAVFGLCVLLPLQCNAPRTPIRIPREED